MDAHRPAAATRARFRAFRPLTTRWIDNDAYGHVNNAIYYSFFDTALTSWMIEHRLLHPTAGDHVFVAAENGCRYHREVAFPEPLEVGLVVARLGTSSVRWEVGVFRAGEPLAAADGHFVHVHVGRVDRRPVPIPPAARAVLQTVAAQADGQATSNPGTNDQGTRNQAGT